MQPGESFLPFLEMFRIIIFKILIKPGYFKADEKEELMQQVQEILLTREKKILDSFQGRARFSTYLAVVVTNICREIRNRELREQSHRSRMIHLPSGTELAQWFGQVPETGILADEKLIIHDFLWKLHCILMTFQRDFQKLIFCLRVISRLRVNIEDLLMDEITDEEMREITLHCEALNLLDAEAARSEIYQHLSEIFNILEGQNNSQDAIRKWMEYKMDQIVRLLNGDPPQSAFTRETLLLLFEYYIRNFRPDREKAKPLSLRRKTHLKTVTNET